MNFTINNYLLKYRTFDELLAEVLNDFEGYSINNMIDSSKLIKVAQFINSSLGSKIRMGEDISKESLLYIEHGKSKLPSNFYKLEFASMCFSYKTIEQLPAGRSYIEGCKTILPPECTQTCPEPINPCVRLNECGEQYFLIERTKTEIREYRQFGRVYVLNSKYISPSCLNNQIVSDLTAYVEKGFIYTNVDEAKIYIRYIGELEDDNGDLLVPDHPLINDYYEYALKRRILENLFIAGENVANQIQFIESRYKEAKVQAETFVNTPDFAEMQAVHNANRKAILKKYFKMFL